MPFSLASCLSTFNVHLTGSGLWCSSGLCSGVRSGLRCAGLRGASSGADLGFRSEGGKVIAARYTPPQQGGMGERCKLPHRGPTFALFK